MAGAKQAKTKATAEQAKPKAKAGDIFVYCNHDKLVDPKTLTPHPKNPNRHPKMQIDMLAKIIKHQGWRSAIVVSNQSGYIVRGHARLAAGLALGASQVPVEFQNYKSNADELADLVADNRIAELANIDNKFIKQIAEELNALEFDLELTGMTNEDIERMNGVEGLTEAEVPEEVPSITRAGDIYELGAHRLICGDATKREDVQRLMGTKRAAMIHTDPPYNVAYGENKKHPSHKIRAIKNDKQTATEWETFCKRLYSNFREFAQGDIYMWGAPGPEGMKMRLWLVEAGCHWSATIVWKKDRLVLTPANYQRMYEPCFYGYFDNSSFNTLTAEQIKQIVAALQAYKPGSTEGPFKKGSEPCFYGWFDKSSFNLSRKETEVWEIPRPTTSKLHPTMKPIEVCARAIMNSSKPGDIVLDLFGGSGSTLIAAEQMGRACYMAELDQHYCDVIVRRYFEYCVKAGKRPVIKRNGKEFVYDK